MIILIRPISNVKVYHMEGFVQLRFKSLIPFEWGFLLAEMHVHALTMTQIPLHWNKNKQRKGQFSQKSLDKMHQKVLWRGFAEISRLEAFGVKLKQVFNLSFINSFIFNC